MTRVVREKRDAFFLIVNLQANCNETVFISSAVSCCSSTLELTFSVNILLEST